MVGAQGQRVGPWTLGARLGRGGNATVWRATREGDTSSVALKVINATKVEREPYQRFVREIAFLREHQGVAGLLPVVDAYLPSEPTKHNAPWLAMPVATPISEALQGKPLSDVVAAVSAIAYTLWRLQRDSGIAHRDIKPGNLYGLDGDWLIGDFGLVALPDTDGLTADGRPLGPAHYTAYEMLRDPASADPHAADVYSLGKTLWVLATDQRFPPEGHQPAGTRQFEIGDFRPHAHAAALDQEIDLMTRIHAEERPSKEQVARDLTAWQELAAGSVALDVLEARARLQQKLKLHMAEQDTLGQRKDLAHAAVRQLQKLTAPLNEALKNLYGRTKIDSASDELTQNMVRSRSRWGQQVEFRWQRCTLVSPIDRPASMTLRMSRCLELVEDGSLRLHMLVLVGPEKVFGTEFSWQAKMLSAPVGSVEAMKMLEDGVKDLAKALADAIEVFVEKLPHTT